MKTLRNVIVILLLIAGCLLIDGSISMAIHAAVTNATINWGLFLLVIISGFFIMIVPISIAFKKGWFQSG